MQSFLGKINFVTRFISDFAKTVKPLQEMIKKDFNFKWTKERREAFEKIKESIAKAPTLWIPNFDNEFILYTFYLIIQLQLFSHKRMKKERNFQYHL